MAKREHRSTSKAAHDSIKQHKEKMYDKIREAMIRLKVGGNFEEIAKAAKMKPEQVWKRLPEMVELGIVYNVGITRPTSSGRKSMVRQLVGLDGKEQMHESAEKIITSTNKEHRYTQPTLF